MRRAFVRLDGTGTPPAGLPESAVFRSRNPNSRPDVRSAQAGRLCTSGEEDRVALQDASRGIASGGEHANGGTPAGGTRMAGPDEAYPLDEVAQASARIAANIERVIDGKPEIVRLAIIVLLAEGHLLIEDVPGVGKTKLAKALARSIDCSVRRIQFTPDLLPSDVTGVSVYNQETRDFEFKPGAVFANLVVGDEINRASPKTQSALLECMEERQVTVDGTTYELQAPFMVIATQNPIEMEGTYPLPEAQRDRFTARIAMGYPDPRAELAMLNGHGAADPLTALRAVTDAAMVRRLIATARDVHAAEAIQQYAIALVTATREAPEIRLGASPRCTLQLLRTAKAVAALEGRDYVLPDDLQALAVPVLAHRIIPTADAQLNRRTTDAIVAEIVHRLPLPHDRSRSPYDTRGNSDGGALYESRGR
jgi:MoxR-like ATPase